MFWILDPIEIKIPIYIETKETRIILRLTLRLYIEALLSLSLKYFGNPSVVKRTFDISCNGKKCK